MTNLIRALTFFPAIMVLLYAGPCYSQTDTAKVKDVAITFIANTGFLIQVEEKSILVDALFGNQAYEFCDIPDRWQIEDMTLAKGQFADVDLVAATHRHVDHFYAPFVSEHLSNNKKALFISSGQAVKELATTDEFRLIQARIAEITPEVLSFSDTMLNGIKIRAYRMKHGPYYIEDSETGEMVNKHRDIENLGFLFDIDGIRIFHSGDSSPACIEDYLKFRLDRENIDIAILGRQFMWSVDCEGIDVIKNYISPKHIILNHIRLDQTQRFKDTAEALKNHFPGVKVFNEKMETKLYHIQ